MLSPQAIERAAVVLKRGEAVILPTDTVPGIFMLDTRENEEKLCTIKRREIDKPFARMFADKRQLKQYARFETELQQKAVAGLLPGKVTLILPSAHKKGEALGVRIPADGSLRTLIRLVGPLIATSANVSGQALRYPGRLPKKLLENVALVEEDAAAGSEPTQITPSTVIDLMSRRVAIARKGGASIWVIARRLGITPYLAAPQSLNILFVCGGNTCRSPMAAALFASHCSQERIVVRSAGLSVIPGAPAAMLAIQVMRSLGLSLGEHRVRGLTPELLRWADLVLVMTRSHLLRIRRSYTRFADRTFLLTGFPAPWPHGRNIDDPIGGSLKIYRSTSRQIQLYTASICAETEKVLSRAS